MARLWVGLNWLKVFPHNSPRRIEAIQRSFVDACYAWDRFDSVELLFHQLCVGTEIAAFYSGIREDKYRRKLRNIALFTLIQRYFDRTLAALVKGCPARSRP